MRLNSDTILVGHVTVLVPYRKEHVPKYHSWMQNPQLLQATASEPLSLEEEYEMQQSWQIDERKCTFIVLAKDAINEHDQAVLLSLCNTDRVDDAIEVSAIPTAGGRQLGLDPDFVTRNIQAMVGDVNLFLSELEEEEDTEPEDDCGEVNEQEAIHHRENSSRNSPAVEDDAGATATTSKQQPQQAEMDIMIAESEWLRKGLGREACVLMMWYASRQMNITRYVSKIHQTNHASRTLFESMGFQQHQFVACFQEYHLELQTKSSQEMIQHLVHIQRQSQVSRGGDDFHHESVPMYQYYTATSAESSPTT